MPELKLGTDEVFEALDDATRPKFRADHVCNGSCTAFGPLVAAVAQPRSRRQPRRGGDAERAAGPSPLVLRDTAGPYDYAVLQGRLEDRDARLARDEPLLRAAGTDDAVTPYIHPGAYFLALKLRSGETTGDLQPVVRPLRVGLPDDPARPHVGAARAEHGHPGVRARRTAARFRATTTTSVINDARLDWHNAARTTATLITAAVAEAPGSTPSSPSTPGTADVATSSSSRPAASATQRARGTGATAATSSQYLYAHGFTHARHGRPVGCPDRRAGAADSVSARRSRPGHHPAAVLSARAQYLSRGLPGAHPDDYAGVGRTSTTTPPTLADAVWLTRASARCSTPSAAAPTTRI